MRGNIFITLGLLATLSACNKPEAELMGIKWCACNQEMSKLYDQLDSEKEPGKIAGIVNSIMVQQNEVIECMGGEQKLAEINKKISDKDKPDFQKIYDETRNEMCPEIVAKLQKKGQKTTE